MAEKPCVIDRIPYRVWPTIPQRTVRKRIADQVDAAFVFAGTNFVNVHRRGAECFKPLCFLVSLNLRERHEDFVGKLPSRLEGSVILV